MNKEELPSNFISNEKKKVLMDRLVAALQAYGDFPRTAATKLCGTSEWTYRHVFGMSWADIKSLAMHQVPDEVQKASTPTVAFEGYFEKPEPRFDWVARNSKKPVQPYEYSPLSKQAEKVPFRGLKAVVIPDTHVPVHDKKAVSAVLTFLEDFKPDLVVLLGDWFDLESVSRHDPLDTDRMRTLEEVRMGRRGLEQIRNAVGKKCLIYFVEGNHETRLERFMLSYCSQLEGVLDFQTLVGFNDLDIQYIPEDCQPLIIGQLGFTHGRYTGTNHAKKHMDMYKMNLMYGHMHDTARHVEPKYGDRPLMAQCVGHLANPRQKYLRGNPTKWQHAFGIVYFNPDGSFHEQVFTIIDGKFIYNGITYIGVE